MRPPIDSHIVAMEITIDFTYGFDLLPRTWEYSAEDAKPMPVQASSIPGHASANIPKFRIISCVSQSKNPCKIRAFEENVVGERDTVSEVDLLVSVWKQLNTSSHKNPLRRNRGICRGFLDAQWRVLG
jgi:hypothetical protein